MKSVCGAFVITTFAVLPLLCQTVEERGGNIYFTGKNGAIIQLTSSALDTSPSLSTDNRFVVFLREKYTVSVFLSRGEVRDKELWIADTSRKKPPRQLLVGNAGLGEFRRPEFSADGKQICFEARSWAADYSIWLLEVTTRRVSRTETGVCRLNLCAVRALARRLWPVDIADRALPEAITLTAAVRSGFQMINDSAL